MENNKKEIRLILILQIATACFMAIVTVTEINKLNAYNSIVKEYKEEMVKYKQRNAQYDEEMRKYKERVNRQNKDF
jgi:uncharacterized membrane protein (DUF106 family)